MKIKHNIPVAEKNYHKKNRLYDKLAYELTKQTTNTRGDLCAVFLAL
jgi:hypothetical protein